MVNKSDILKHQATGWDHYRPRENNSNQKKEVQKIKENKLFSWIMKTINPINHIPVIGTIKNINSKAEKSLDIVQSAIGGIIYGGPYGFLKGIGGWVAGKIFTKNKTVTEKLDNKSNDLQKNSFKSKDSESKNKNLIKSESLPKSNKHPKQINLSSNQFNFEVSSKNYLINEKSSILYKADKVMKTYAFKTNNTKNKIDISA